MTYCNNTRTGSAIKLPVPEILLFWVVLATLLPNIILAFTEHMSPAQSATNILLGRCIFAPDEPEQPYMPERAVDVSTDIPCGF